MITKLNQTLKIYYIMHMLYYVELCFDLNSVCYVTLLFLAPSSVASRRNLGTTF